MNKQKINLKKYVFVFVLTTLIFVIGLFVGSMFTSKNLANLDKMEQDIMVQTMAIELQFQLIAENPCLLANSTAISEELYLLSDRLDYMENSLGYDDPRVLSLKDYYSILELRHWLLSKKINENCGSRNNLILYFYSNKGDCNKCKEQGYVLTYIKKKYPDTMVYTFDINIDNLALKTVKDIYIQSQDMPVLIINDKAYYGFKDSDQIESLLLKTE